MPWSVQERAPRTEGVQSTAGQRTAAPPRARRAAAGFPSHRAANRSHTLNAADRCAFRRCPGADSGARTLPTNPAPLPRPADPADRSASRIAAPRAPPPARGSGGDRQRPAFVCPGPGRARRSSQSRAEPSHSHSACWGCAASARPAPSPPRCSAWACLCPRGPAAARRGAAALGEALAHAARTGACSAAPSPAEPPARCRGREAAPHRPGLSQPEGRPRRHPLKGASGTARPARVQPDVEGCRERQMRGVESRRTAPGKQPGKTKVASARERCFSKRRVRKKLCGAARALRAALFLHPFCSTAPRSDADVRAGPASWWRSPGCSPCPGGGCAVEEGGSRLMCIFWLRGAGGGLLDPARVPQQLLPSCAGLGTDSSIPTAFRK